MGKGSYNGGSSVLYTGNVYSRMGEQPRYPAVGALPELSKEDYAEAVKACSQVVGKVSVDEVLRKHVKKTIASIPAKDVPRLKEEVAKTGRLPHELDRNILAAVAKGLNRQTLEETKRKAVRALAVALLKGYTPPAPKPRLPAQRPRQTKKKAQV